MKRSVITAIIIVIVVAAGVALFTHKSTNDSNMPGMSSSPSTNSSAVATDAVSISNFSFSPAAITVKKGTTVTWTNHDSVNHTVTETDGKTGPGSQGLGNSQTYSFTYNTVGTFAYHCSIHPEMTGTVTVTE